MVRTHVRALAIEALGRALETMAFMDVIEADVTAEHLGPGDFVAAAVDFSGPVCGTVRVVIARELGRTLVENVLLKGPCNEQQIADAVKELANITCGLLLPMVTVIDEPEFDVTVSRLEDCSDAAVWKTLIASPHVQWGRAGDGLAAIQCIIRD